MNRVRKVSADRKYSMYSIGGGLIKYSLIAMALLFIVDLLDNFLLGGRLFGFFKPIGITLLIAFCSGILIVLPRAAVARLKNP